MNQEFYNNITFIEEFEKATRLSMSYMTLRKYVKKGFIVPTGFMKNGKQNRPVYSHQALENFIVLIPKLQREKKIRLFPLPNADK